MGTKVCFFKVITRSQDTFHNFTLHGLRKAFLGKGKTHKSARCRCLKLSNISIMPWKCVPGQRYPLYMSRVWISSQWEIEPSVGLSSDKGK